MEVRQLQNLPRIGGPSTLTPETARINPNALMIVLLDELCGRLADMTELTAKMERQMQRAPEGVMRPFTKTITETEGDPARWNVKKHIGRNASYAVVDNRGDDSVWVCLNDIRDGFKEVRKNEKVTFDYRGHDKIHRFFFYVAAGDSVAIEIMLEY